MKSPEIDSYVYEQSSICQRCQGNAMRKEQSLQQMVLELDIHMQKNEPQSTPHIIDKN